MIAYAYVHVLSIVENILFVKIIMLMKPLLFITGNCPPGSYSLDGICESCEIGSYQDQEGQTSCIVCVSGYTTVDTASESVDSCITDTVGGELLEG